MAWATAVGLSGEWVEGERDRWQQERRAAEHDLVDAQLSIGLGDELVAPLSARVVQHPLDELVAGQYMLALHRAGRPADALDHYWQLRERLVEELGTDPSKALQNLHQQILAADTSLIPTPADTTTEPVVIPQQLPAAPVPFVGRRNELDNLDTTLHTSSPNQDTTPSGWARWLLMRRSLTPNSNGELELAYYLCCAPTGTTDDELVRVAGARRAVEECFQTAKTEVGLDHYQVRCYDAWYRHITLAMLAHTYLAVTAAIAPKALAAASSQSRWAKPSVSWHT